MPFTEEEIAEHLQVIEQAFWSKRRPPLHLRDKVREGQRLAGYTLELFFLRPAWDHPEKLIECPIAKVRYVRSEGNWRIFWQRGSGKWQSYAPAPETKTLAAALYIIHEDAYGCFFG